VLLKHPLSNDGQIVWYYDFLDWLRARRRASNYLDAGIARFPESPVLHQRLRMHVLRRRGADALEKKYEDMLAAEGASPSLPWYAGYASTVAADVHRRGKREQKAMEAYARALKHYDRAVELNPRSKPSVDHQAALVLAGRARVAYQLDDDDLALAEILASFERGPASAGTRDGVGITPGETGQMLLARLRREERADLAAILENALARLDPELLRPDRP
jgi:tetratricopeptide (TPR) repeat protein